MRFIVSSLVIGLVLLGLFIINFDSVVLKVLERHPDRLASIIEKYYENKKTESEKNKLREMAKSPIHIDTITAPKKGPAKAKYNLVVFTDYQCPYCMKLEDTLASLEASYGDKIQMAYMHLPLAFHKQAIPAARAAWAAQQQGKFFEYSEKLFANQRELNEDLFMRIANELSLNIPKFKLDKESERSLQAVNYDKETAKANGFTGTPVVLVSGIPVMGAFPVEYFEMVFQILDEKN